MFSARAGRALDMKEGVMNFSGYPDLGVTTFRRILLIPGVGGASWVTWLMAEDSLVACPALREEVQ